MEFPGPPDDLHPLPDYLHLPYDPFMFNMGGADPREAAALAREATGSEDPFPLRIFGFIAHFQERPNPPGQTQFDRQFEEMMLNLEREMLFSLADQYADELGVLCTPLTYTFTNLSHVPYDMYHPIKGFIHSILDASRTENCEAVFVLRRWDSITADKDTFMLLFERCIDQPEIRARLKIYDPSAWERPNGPHFIDVDPANVCMCIGGFVDPSDPTEGFEPNTRRFLKKLEEISQVNASLWPNYQI